MQVLACKQGPLRGSKRRGIGVGVQLGRGHAPQYVHQPWWREADGPRTTRTRTPDGT